jgi:hypothetical protein
MFRELVEKDLTYRGLVVPASDIAPYPANYCRYCSLFLFGKDINDYVKLNKSVKGYKGNIYADAIWVDIDATDLREAQETAITLVKRLNADYQINPDCLFIYFSGNKGFHIAIHATLVGFAQNEPVTADKVKDFVRRITSGLPHIDLGIIEPVRLFRIENSMNEKSGLYKIRISYTELQCEIEDIKRIASKPRTATFKIPQGDFKQSDRLNAVWVNSGAYVQEQKEVDYKGNLFAPPMEGGRNNMLFRQACMLFRKSELSANAILDIISNAAFISNLNAKEKVSDQELRNIVRSAQSTVGDERKKAIVEELQMKSFGEWIPEWEQFTLQEQTNMTLCFWDFNQLIKGRLKGRMGVLMGYGGAKKSLYALNVAMQNLALTDEIALYSTMEMGVPQLMNRVIDHEVRDPKGEKNASEVLAEAYKHDVEDGRKYMVELSKKIGNRLQIIGNSRMTYEYYKQAVKKCKETIGTPGILIVDGLSMMGGKGTETELYNQNSADLKQLANEENLFVILICHVSKGAEKWTRDLSQKIRGSEKILDNCDFYMTLSQIQDQNNPEMFRKDIGFINFCDKRNSGDVINTVYGFDPKRLQMLETQEDWRNYYEPVKTRAKSEALDF